MYVLGHRNCRGMTKKNVRHDERNRMDYRSSGRVHCRVDKGGTASSLRNGQLLSIPEVIRLTSCEGCAARRSHFQSLYSESRFAQEQVGPPDGRGV